MATYPEQFPGELQRLAGLIAGLREDVDALRSRSFRVPILNQDPPASDPTNMWAFPDGRIRVRMPDGSVINFIKDAAGSSTSGTAVPTTPQVQTYQLNSTSLWTQTYRGDDTKRTSAPDRVFYGNNSDGFGTQKSLIGFNAGDFAALAGATIQRVQLRFHQLDCYMLSGCDLHVGGHANTSAPGGWGGIYRGDVSTVHFGGQRTAQNTISTAEYKYVDISTAFGDWLRDGLIKGVSINQPSSSRSYYGYGVGAGPADSPALAITYTK